MPCPYTNFQDKQALGVFFLTWLKVLFGNPKFSDNVNSGIIYAVIKFIGSTNRFSGSIYD